MNQSKFAVSSFENRNGVTSWRVDGRLHGVRIRKNFKTREEAAAEKAVLEIKALQTSAGLRQIATALTEEQIREAEALFQRMQGRARSLSF
ncbi:MAG TPA: site-specific integrase, partial [Chloroflexota bacterium]|nr:site-specific integrase [Chloroflexota bacterium]